MHRLNLPYHLWGHTLGPFENGLGIRYIRPILRSAEEVVVREQISKDLALSIAPDAKVLQLPDFAFSTSLNALAPTHTDRLAALVPRGHILDSQLADEPGLIAEFAALARGLLERGLVDRVLIVPQVVGPSTTENDEEISRLIVEAASDSRVSAAQSGLSPLELARLYEEAEGVVAIRLHGAILALASGTPAFAISYFTAKTQGVLEGAGMADSWTTFNEFSAQATLEWWEASTGPANRSRVAALAERHRNAFEKLSELHRG